MKRHVGADLFLEVVFYGLIVAVITIVSVAIIIASITIINANRTAVRMGQPIYDKAAKAFFSELSFGAGGFATIYFRTPELAAEFARVADVEVVMRAAPVRIARSEVVVEAER